MNTASRKEDYSPSLLQPSEPDCTSVAESYSNDATAYAADQPFLHNGMDLSYFVEVFSVKLEEALKKEVDKMLNKPPSI